MSDIQVPDEVIRQAIRELVTVPWGVSYDGPDEREVVECVAPIIAAWARKQALSEVRAARAQHPKCDVHDDDDPVTCGWKRVVQDIDALLAETKETSA